MNLHTTVCRPSEVDEIITFLHEEIQQRFEKHFEDMKQSAIKVRYAAVHTLMKQPHLYSTTMKWNIARVLKLDFKHMTKNSWKS